jgi:hypothetical protein
MPALAYNASGDELLDQSHVIDVFLNAEKRAGIKVAKDNYHGLNCGYCGKVNCAETAKDGVRCTPPEERLLNLDFSPRTLKLLLLFHCR